MIYLKTHQILASIPEGESCDRCQLYDYESQCCHLIWGIPKIYRMRKNIRCISKPPNTKEKTNSKEEEI